jgi:aminoglycoside phosphotransferase (APT) family kinase protein
VTGTTAPVAAGIDFDPARLRAYLAEGWPELEGEMRVERVGGGQSNPTYFWTFDTR